ncbi:MmcQ/YjbR family DNA-binding protein [Nocardioides sp. AX2bis]|uniref:MmcQ/YjbR family DNA-binding protein n=1 Tax=Nocardioides sp. AX2bis TaxID=2653157 RepID=UPI0012F27074|nr:MmcQ/YjbR family DNA-binding protein [Nocardioides sp. AX2bis]VXB82201.1 Phosphoribosylglycinamide formyltransferase [Nocardioides sp. AX2bis]
MTHPIMFDEDDPVLARLRDAAARLPDVHEKVSHGRPVLTAGEKGKVFAVYGGGVKVRPGEHERHDHAVLLKPDPAEAGALAEDDRFFSPAYYGPSGWVGLDLDGAAHDVDWTEVGELLESSYRTVAGKRLLDRLDADT